MDCRAFARRRLGSDAGCQLNATARRRVKPGNDEEVTIPDFAPAQSGLRSCCRQPKQQSSKSQVIKPAHEACMCGRREARW